MKSEYRLLVYKKVGRHKLIRRFRSYWRMSEWSVKIANTIKFSQKEKYWSRTIKSLKRFPMSQKLISFIII